MKNTIYSTILTFIVAFAFSGCAGKSVIVQGAMKNYPPLGADKIYKVSAANTYDSNYSGAKYIYKNNEHRFLIEADAITTLSYGYKYFRIIKPIDTSSEMITSPEELKNICFDESVINTFVNAEKQCSYQEKNVPFVNIIAVYKEKPSDALTISAQEVIDYLSLHDSYIDADNYNFLEFKDEFLITK